jgi:hypothetical protein
VESEADPEFIANSFFAWSARLLGDAEAVTGDDASARDH